MCRLVPTLTLLVILSGSQLQAADWPQWRGPDRTGVQDEPGLRMDWRSSPPEHEWTIDGMGGGYASVSIADGRLYTTGNFSDGQSVVCVDLDGQKVLWRTPVTNSPPQHSYEGSRCTPTLDGDNVYVVTSDGGVACLKKENGEIVWSRSFRDWNGRLMSGWGFSESPLVDGDHVVCTPGGPNAMMVCLDKNTGRDIWTTTVPYSGSRGKDGAGYSSIVISNAAGVKQYVQMTGRGLIGVEAATGSLLWGYDKVANDVANIPTPIVEGDYVFGSTGYQTGAALLKLSRRGNQVNAEEVYFLPARTFQNHHGGMVKIDEFIYAGHQHGKGFPICINMMTGRVRWGGDFRPEGQGSAAITAVNDQIIFRYQDGTLALINANPRAHQLMGTFRPEYQERESWSHPVVVDGKLYLREQDKLMCYTLTNVPAE